MTAFWNALATAQAALAAQAAALDQPTTEGLWQAAADLSDAVARLQAAWTPETAASEAAQAALTGFHRTLERHQRVLALRLEWHTTLLESMAAAAPATVW